MADEFLGDRKKALEDSFFARENAKLVENMRAEKNRQDGRQQLVEISGITDPAVIDKLVELNVGTHTWAAMSLVPLVEVAWADGKVEEKERSAVLAAAEANGVTSGSPSYALLETWLLRRPDGRLLEGWGQYIVGVCAQLGPAERRTLESEILGRARAVAESAGGILGLGNKVSKEEEVVLSELQKAFSS